MRQGGISGAARCRPGVATGQCVRQMFFIAGSAGDGAVLQQIFEVDPLAASPAPAREGRVIDPVGRAHPDCRSNLSTRARISCTQGCSAGSAFIQSCVIWLYTSIAF